MSVADRDGAWAALADPATDATALAVIAGTYPEFAEAIGRHPNAYPALIGWAHGTATQQTSSAGYPPVQADPRAVVEPAGWLPPVRSADPSTRHRALWIVALAVYEGVPILQVLIPGELFNLGGSGGVVWFAVLNTWTVLAFAVVAAIVAPTGARKVVAAACGVGTFAVDFAQLTLQFDTFGGTTPMGVQVITELLSITLLFLCWAVARPLVGTGYAALPIALAGGVVLRLAVYPWISTYVYTTLARDQHLNGMTAGILNAVVIEVLDTAFIIGAALLSSAWSRRSEQRAAQLAAAR